MLPSHSVTSNIVNIKNMWKVNVELSLCWLSTTPRRRIHCLFKHHDVKKYWGSGGIAPRILNVGNRWRWVVSFALQPVYHRIRSLSYPASRLCGPQSRYGRCGEQKNFNRCHSRESKPGRQGCHDKLLIFFTQLQICDFLQPGVQTTRIT
jgi:hypothetical protein